MMTKEELIASDDSVLLDLIDRAKGNTGKDFSTAMKCDFSYSFVTTELQRRGYKNGWYKENAIEEDKARFVNIEPDVKIIRRSYTIPEEIAKEWSEYTKNMPTKEIILGMALKDFMEKHKNKWFEFKF